MALYAAHLHTCGLKGSTIQTHLSAIAYHHKLNGCHDPTKAFLIQKLLAAYQRHDKPQPVRQPITQDVLQKLLDSLTNCSLPLYHQHLFRALFSLMYHAALRCSEVTHSPTNSHNLQASQISVVHKGSSSSLAINFITYKHSAPSPPPIIIHSTGSSVCPVRLYLKYLQFRQHRCHLPAFCLPDGSPLMRTVLVTTLHTVLGTMGLAPHLYNTHSFRIGRATDMSHQGCSYSQIATLGRWKSNAFVKYIKPTAIHTSAL